MKKIRELITRACVACFLALVFGLIAGTIAFEWSGTRGAIESINWSGGAREPALREARLRYLYVTIPACFLLVLAVRRIELGRTIRYISYGVLAGVAMVVVPIVLCAVGPVGNKISPLSPVAVRIVWAAALFASLAGGIAGFVYSRRCRQSIADEPLNPSPSEPRP